MWRMANPRMDYDWGSLSVIPEFLGEAPTSQPVAEVWMGAHPKASSTLLDFEGEDVPLDRAIHEHPVELLGSAGLQRFGTRLPYLVKFLAADKPLSLQVHPDAQRAERGYGEENSRGVPMSAAERTYKDPHHKPETMIALERTITLAGFRSAERAGALLSAIDGEWAAGVRGLLDDRDMTQALRALLDQDSWQRHGPDVLARCRALAAQDRAFALVQTLHRHFPDDSGVMAPVLLNAVVYDLGEALFIPTGQIHAHVQGFGIEVMAASDNVIRAGLTTKHKDQDALLRSLVSRAQTPTLRAVGAGRLNVGVQEFQIHMMTPGQAAAGFGPQLFVALEEGTVLSSTRLKRGETVFMRHGEAPVLERGWGCLVHEPVPE